MLLLHMDPGHGHGPVRAAELSRVVGSVSASSRRVWLVSVAVNAHGGPAMFSDA